MFFTFTDNRILWSNLTWFTSGLLQLGLNDIQEGIFFAIITGIIFF
jgi:hypothetical protein